MSPHATWLLGWAFLAAMGAISAWIIGSGLLRACRVLFPGRPSTPSALPTSLPLRRADPQPRVTGAGARPTAGERGHG